MKNMQDMTDSNKTNNVMPQQQQMPQQNMQNQYNTNMMGGGMMGAPFGMGANPMMAQ
jgi:hypothetical protein